MQSIVTENDRAAAKAIQFLKMNNIGRVRFLPLNKIHSYKPSAHALLIAKKDGAIGFAQDLVKFDTRYKDAFGNVFGDTVIMESLDDAREHLGKGRMVTLQGELLEGGGALVGGAAPRTGIHFGTSDRDDIDELTTSIRKLEAEKLQISAELGELIEEAGQLATARQELERERDREKTARGKGERKGNSMGRKGKGKGKGKRRERGSKGKWKGKSKEKKNKRKKRLTNT